MQLPEAERDYLAEKLWRSVHAKALFDPEQVAEWDRRLDDMQTGRIEPLTYDQFFADDDV